MFNNFSMPGWLWNGSVLPEVHGGGDGGAGLLGIVDSLLNTVTNLLESGSGGGPLAGVMVLGSNVHPIIVHFPIAFLVGFFGLEIVGVTFRLNAARQLASGLLYLGALGAVAAVAAGLIAEDLVPHGAAVHEIMEWHERLGITVAILSVGLAVWRAVSKGNFSGMAQALHFFLAGIVMACLLFGTDLGGLMVYQYGVGVKNLQQANDHHHDDGHHHVDDSSQTGEPGSAGNSTRIETPGPAAVAPAAAPVPADAVSPTGDHSHHHHHHHHSHGAGGGVSGH